MLLWRYTFVKWNDFQISNSQRVLSAGRVADWRYFRFAERFVQEYGVVAANMCWHVWSTTSKLHRRFTFCAVSFCTINLSIFTTKTKEFPYGRFSFWNCHKLFLALCHAWCFKFRRRGIGSYVPCKNRFFVFFRTNRFFEPWTMQTGKNLKTGKTAPL